MQSDPREYTLEFLLDFDGRVHWLASGHCLKFKIRRVGRGREGGRALKVWHGRLQDPELVSP